MTDYYQVKQDGSICLILEARIISETQDSITIQPFDYGDACLCLVKSRLLTSLDSAKEMSRLIISRKIEYMKRQLETQEKNLNGLSKLEDEQLRSSKFNSFFVES